MKLEHSTPSHDTVCQVFGILSPDEVECAFGRWVGMMVPPLAEDERIARCVRSGYAANNLAIVRHNVMSLLRLNTTRQASIKSKRMLAATIDEFRAEVLGVTLRMQRLTLTRRTNPLRPHLTCARFLR